MSMISASGNTPILPTHQPLSSTRDAAAPNSSNQSSGNRSTPAGFSSSASLSSPSATVSRKPSSGHTNSQHAMDTYLHWCIDPTRIGTKLVEFNLQNIRDSELVPTLLKAYRTVRGLSGWISLTTCSGARLVKFKRMAPDNDIIACVARSIPCHKTNDNYSYDYQDPEAEFIRFVEELIAYRVQNPCCNLPMVLNVLPKKIRGKLEKDFGVEGYGLRAVSTWSLWKGFLAFLILSIPPCIFAIRWLIGHEGDLQNSFMLEVLLMGALNIFVIKLDSQMVTTK
ncbi:hypothetical protein GJ744_003182 [Endocarpon pusillum]|uniref:Uncharacterized protein n=1 Tax=Endocarpon pusillum TaxID=364733 RepID=A0A8H7API0_9EURO|nr:hypothetical protein GJ744_003182 [Endocarpon pusillum]